MSNNIIKILYIDVLYYHNKPIIYKNQLAICSACFIWGWNNNENGFINILDKINVLLCNM